MKSFKGLSLVAMTALFLFLGGCQKDIEKETKVYNDNFYKKEFGISF